MEWQTLPAFLQHTEVKPPFWTLPTHQRMICQNTEFGTRFCKYWQFFTLLALISPATLGRELVEPRRGLECLNHCVALMNLLAFPLCKGRMLRKSDLPISCFMGQCGLLDVVWNKALLAIWRILLLHVSGIPHRLKSCFLIADANL